MLTVLWTIEFGTFPFCYVVKAKKKRNIFQSRRWQDGSSTYLQLLSIHGANNSEIRVGSLRLTHILPFTSFESLNWDRDYSRSTSAVNTDRFWRTKIYLTEFSDWMAVKVRLDRVVLDRVRICLWWSVCAKAISVFVFGILVCNLGAAKELLYGYWFCLRF